MVEREQGSQIDNAISRPNFEPLVKRVKTGDKDAFEDIYNYFRPRLIQYFSTRLPSEAEDLTQDTLEKVVRHINDFEPKVKGAFSECFLGWCFTIARNSALDELPKQFRRDSMYPLNPWEKDMQEEGSRELFPRNFQDGRESQEEQSKEELLLMLKDKVTEIFARSEYLRQIAGLAIDGKSNAEIYAAFPQHSKGAIREGLSKVRKKIEENFLFPAGYKRAAALDHSAHKAARDGRLSSVKFMHIWYTTEEDAKRYQVTKRAVDQELLDDGYVLLSEAASAAESLSLRRYNLKLLRVYRGRHYIRPESLEEFREKRASRRAKIVPLNPESQELGAFAKTESKYHRLSRAAQLGKLKATKERGRWFVTQQAIEEFLGEPNEG